jgi:hypothetical protein
MSELQSYPRAAHSVALDDVEKWRRDLASLNEEIRLAIDRRIVLERKIDAADKLFALLAVEDATREGPSALDHQTSVRPVLFPNATHVTKPSDFDLDPNDTFIAAVTKIVDAHEDGITTTQIREILLRSPLADRLLASDKGFYHAFPKLQERRRIVRHNGRIFSNHALDAHLAAVAAGIKSEPGPEALKSQSPLQSSILEIVSERPGASSKEVIEQLVLDGKVNGSERTKVNSVYNSIATLISRGEIKKMDGRLFPPNSDFLDLLSSDGSVT